MSPSPAAAPPPLPEPGPPRPADPGSIIESLLATPWQAWAKLGGAILLGGIVYLVVFWLLRRVVRRSDTVLDNAFVRRLGRPAQILLPVLAIQLVLPWVTRLSPPVLATLRHVMSVATIVGVGWLVVALVQATAELVKSRHDVTAADNYAARRMHTQVNVISRVLGTLIVVVAVGLALMTFPRVRELGTSLLASAGIAGIVIGLAARPLLENMIAGVQLALTQPINIDDVVVVDGEWGRIEQITSTYVVVRIWDERRLICPFSKFIGDSFQNWTRRRADILGTIIVHADYTVPVDAVRRELERIVHDHELWDGRVCVLQVTEAGPETVQLRALVSTADAPRGWDLRVDVREKLVAYLQREHPECLPRRRVELPRNGDDPAPA